MEIWKTITDYPNYQVSNYGNVKNIRFNRIVILMIKLNLKIILL